VLVEEIDVVGPKTLKARLRHAPDMFGPAIRPAAACAGFKIDIETELGGKHDLAADRLERFANQFFIRERPVGLGGIEMGDAQIVSRANQLDHFALVGCRPIGRTHAHATEPNGRHFEIAISKFSFLHLVVLAVIALVLSN